MDSGPADIRRSTATQILTQIAAGDVDAYEQLVPLVYDELRQVAAGVLRDEQDHHTLGCTGLVHEAYLRLIDQREMNWEGRAHFLGMAARTMRRVLVDWARRRQAEKRYGRRHRVELTESAALDPDQVFDVVALGEILDRLATVHPRHAQLVEMRVFGGMTFEEASVVLGVSDRTLKTDMRFVKAWLSKELRERREE